ncbi:MAG: hypothetical protein AAGA42_13705 [Actinomycetota bacterium]
MTIGRFSCPARAALAGNPSDGYGGAVVAVPVDACRATVRVDHHDRFAIDPAPTPDDTFGTWDELSEHVSRFGYRGSRPLLLAALRRFSAHTGRPPVPVAVHLSTSIPRSVGLAGSSAIVIAMLRGLYAANDIVTPPPDELASLALSVEVDELGISAGLQDRVVQAYGAPVAMEFGPAAQRSIAGMPAGTYRTLDWEHLGPLLVAARPTDAEPSHVPHDDLRSRHARGDRSLGAAMDRLADTARWAARAIDDGDRTELCRALDASFDIRAANIGATPGQHRSVEIARAAGGSANSTGSGGSIVVAAHDDVHGDALADALTADGCVVLPVGPAG